ncbi:MAG TPA: N-acyl homoserine lactonase family protein [Acidimicrobiales bacterium]|jgi:glyoxylase-like metal-dependent hydrolase (beta-lactamase superfamily II)
MPLAVLPRIERMLLAVVETVPEWHPEHATFEPFPVFGWVVRHPDGPILVDTGVGIGNAAIDGWYRPRVTPLADALAAVGVDPRDVAAVVLSHLHFDHCGQQAALACPVHVQAAEWDAARADHYTIPEWAAIPGERLRLVDGDAEPAPGVRIVATPGHTPGHQSVVVEGGGERVVLAGQCVFRAAELRQGEPSMGNMFGAEWVEAGRDSVRRLLSLGPATAQVSHDPEVVDIPG